jgi:hypothetical protein
VDDLVKNLVPGIEKINQEKSDKDNAANSGGIDLNPVDRVMSVGTADAGAFFRFDPVSLEKYRDAAGVSPVIIDIHPVEDLPGFLGVAPSRPAP